MKRFLCLLLCLLLPAASLAEGWMNSGDQDDAVGSVTDDAVYDAADSVGQVVNTGAPGEPTDQQKIAYSFTPLEVVLIIDVSGSMDSRDRSNNKSLLDYAKLASESFRNTLMTMNPASRVAMVAFDDRVVAECGLTGASDQAKLIDSINRLSPGGRTNTGGGFLRAAELLENDAMPGRRRVVLMLTDGIANEGVGDPNTYAINNGRRCAKSGMVYTIGLVGGMDESNKRQTRKILEAGYQTRYFEVDFDNVADAGAQINQIATTIAMSASSGEAVDASGKQVSLDMYQFSVGAGFQARVTSPDGACLSSFPGDYSTGAYFGTMSVVDGRQHFVMIEGDYAIDIQGVSTREGGYTLSRLQGEKMKASGMAEYPGWSHESIGVRITVSGDKAETEITGYSVLDPYAVDAAGQATHGLDASVGAVLNRQTEVFSAPARNATKIDTLQQNTHIRLLAMDGSYYFITFVDEKGTLNRGWINMASVTKVNGFVPMMSWLEGEYTLAEAAKAHGAPEEDSAVVKELKKGAKVNLRHVERSSTGEEWAYVAINKQQNGYLPVEALSNWGTIAPPEFRIGADLAPFADELEFEDVYFQRGHTWKVYSSASTNSWRGANGKAEVSTNDVVYVAGWVRGFLLVAYETNSGNRRVGYVNGKDIKCDIPDFPVLAFRMSKAKLSADCTLTDDPMHESTQVVKLKAGAEVTWLSSYTSGYGEELAYVQTKANGKIVRGFIPAECLE